MVVCKYISYGLKCTEDSLFKRLLEERWPLYFLFFSFLLLLLLCNPPWSSFHICLYPLLSCGLFFPYKFQFCRGILLYMMSFLFLIFALTFPIVPFLHLFYGFSLFIQIRRINTSLSKSSYHERNCLEFVCSIFLRHR